MRKFDLTPETRLMRGLEVANKNRGYSSERGGARDSISEG